METTISRFIIFSLCVNVCVCKKYYHNHTLFRGIPSTDAHLEYYRNLSQKFDVNYWREPGLLLKPVEFVVNPENKPIFLDEARRNGLYITTMIEDLQKAFDKQTVKTYIRRKMDSFGWDSYYRVKDIYQWMKDLEMYNPLEFKVDSIGKTSEKRDIMAAKIRLRGCNSSSKVIIEGGIHAREWISPAFVTYLIHQIIYSRDSGNKQLMDIALKFEWYFVPVLNPDGYEYCFTEDREWRKNRNGNGVDLNRNFDSEFGTVGVGRIPVSDTYCGKSAFSEKESRAMRKFVESIKENLEFYIAFHAYGQYMIIPYAYSKNHIENFNEVKKMCQKAVPKLAARYRTKYTFGTAYDTVGYMSSGVSSCWVKKTMKVPWQRVLLGFAFATSLSSNPEFAIWRLDSCPVHEIRGAWVSAWAAVITNVASYVITFELRDNGLFGFALPTDQILPTCKETLDGMISLLTSRNNKTIELREVSDSAERHFLDDIVILFNVLLFIIVRFD